MCRKFNQLWLNFNFGFSDEAQGLLFSLHEIFANYDIPTSRLRVTATRWCWLYCRKHFVFKSALWWIIILRGYYITNNIYFISAKFNDIPMTVTHGEFITRKRFLHTWLPGDFPHKASLVWNFHVFFVVDQIQLLNKGSNCRSFRRHYVSVMSLSWTLGTTVIFLQERHMMIFVKTTTDLIYMYKQALNNVFTNYLPLTRNSYSVISVHTNNI